MKKIIIIGIISILLLTSFSTLSAFGKITSATNEIVVPDDYPTIQDAIAHANHGDTIRVRPGTYYENIVISEMLTLVGSGTSSTIIDGGGIRTVVTIYGGGTKISGFTIRNGGDAAAGIRCEGNDGSYNIIEDVHIKNNGIGIELLESTGNELKNNVITQNTKQGISIYRAHANVISGNTISDNEENGILLDFSSIGNEIYENIISNNEIGINIAGNCRSITIYHNNFIENTQNAYGGLDSDTWYNSDISEGNYWDDYTGTDADSDGIGDTPYSIPGSDCRDLYPFMEPLILNKAPNKPSCNYVKSSNSLSVSAIDPDGDQIRFGVSWNNDGNVDDWTDFYNSGEEAKIDCGEHKGTAGVIAEDENGAQSLWHSVDSTSKAKSHPILAKLLELFPNAFPILRLLLKL